MDLFFLHYKKNISKVLFLRIFVINPSICWQAPFLSSIAAHTAGILTKISYSNRETSIYIERSRKKTVLTLQSIVLEKSMCLSSKEYTWRPHEKKKYILYCTSEYVVWYSAGVQIDKRKSYILFSGYIRGNSTLMQINHPKLTAHWRISHTNAFNLI